MTTNKNNGANLGFENKLWEMADKLRGHMDAAEYKHVVLGLIFLKYISDAFQEKYEDLKADFLLANPPFNMSDWGGERLKEDDGVPFEEKMAHLTAKLYEQFEEAHRLEAEIRKNLKVLGFEKHLVKRNSDFV